MGWSRGNPPLSVRAARLHGDLVRSGVDVNDMRRAPALELQFAGAGDGPARGPEDAPAVEPLEGRFETRRVTPCPPRDTRFRWFIDGAQKTLPWARFGPVPVAVVVTAVGIVRREPGGACTMERGTLRMDHRWIVPGGTGIPGIEDLLRRLGDGGFAVEDPLAPRQHEERLGDAFPGPLATDYGWMMQRTYETARAIRDRNEQEALGAFWTPERQDGDGWILVDGRLRQPLRHAAGLVKQFTKTYLRGPDAATLLSLEPGCRTTAFHPGDRRRGGPDPERRTLWYLRLWDPSQLDARHSLVRVEVDQSVTTSDEIDAISSWLLAERTPRATGDARWATLLYPVHQLERVLKRQLDAQTRGWAGN